MSVETEVVHEATDELVEAFARLLPQLSSKAKPLDHEAVASLVTSSTNTLLVARVGDVIVGTLTLVTSPLPSGPRAHIEDVVVDTAARGPDQEWWHMEEGCVTEAWRTTEVA
ncbi:GNAT family N-acetyltransferase [Streptomyces sp. NPDC051320]|uniref:GNAT family N-acetyltransferase n=1 Tax=Streptomyces sp. NPDC051320 TaxID=3154644 RepID=UPI0034131D98